MTGRAKSILWTLVRALGLVLFNGLVVYWAAKLLPDFHIPNFQDAVLIALFVMARERDPLATRHLNGIALRRLHDGPRVRS